MVTGAGVIDFLGQASTDGSTMLLPVLSSRLGLSAANPRLGYTAAGFDLVEAGASDSFAKTATYNAFSSAIADGQFATLAPNGSAAVAFSVNPAEWAQTPALGLMVVTQDNKNGSDEANLVKVELKH
jgi:minor extracellular serine protease Vpr